MREGKRLSGEIRINVGVDVNLGGWWHYHLLHRRHLLSNVVADKALVTIPSGFNQTNDPFPVVSDTSFFNLEFLGQLGTVPGWPGAEVYPPQPMMSQTRAVLDTYQVNGGQHRKVVLPDCGHSPHIEK